MRIIFLLLVASLTFAQKPTLQKDRQILLDFRKDRTAAQPKIPAATQRMVLSKLFRRYLADSNKCNPDLAGTDSSDYLAAARKAGQIVPSIVAMATGSFTAPGQSQTLYVISVSECNASHADMYGTKRVAIFSGQQLVADVDVDFKDSIEAKTDLNSDGIDELLMSTSDMHQGNIDEVAALLSFQNGRMRVIHDFGPVVEDTCASESPGSYSKASVLYISDVVPGEMPKLSVETFQAGCGKTRRWRLISRGKMQD